jgi:hypothetical protein
MEFAEVSAGFKRRTAFLDPLRTSATILVYETLYIPNTFAFRDYS